MAMFLRSTISLSDVTWLVGSDLLSDFTLWKGIRIMSKSPGMVLVAVCCVLSGEGFSRDKPVTYAGRQNSAGALCDALSAQA